MAIKSKVVTSVCDTNSEKMVIFPENYYDQKDYRYHESALSFYKYAKDRVGIEYLETPELLLEQRSADWFGPVLCVTTIALSNNPLLISIATNVIANYLTDIFKGKSTPNVRLKILLKESGAEKFTEIQYEGSVSGLSEVTDAVADMMGNIHGK